MSGKGLDNIKGKTPTTNDLAKHALSLGQRALRRWTLRSREAAGRSHRPAIMVNIRSWHTERATRSHATHTAAARTAEVRPESHVATNPHLQHKRIRLTVTVERFG